MAYFLEVEILYGFNYLNKHISSSCFIEASDLVDSIEELSTFANISNEIEISFVFERLVKSDDIGIIHLAKDVHLVHEYLWIFD